MKRGLVSSLILLLLSAGCLAQNKEQPDGEADARALAEAEREFCRDVVARGVRREPREPRRGVMFIESILLQDDEPRRGGM